MVVAIVIIAHPVRGRCLGRPAREPLAGRRPGRCRARRASATTARRPPRTELEPVDVDRARSGRPRALRRDARDARRRARRARRGGEVVEYEPVDEEELGVTRRQFLNRGILIAVGFGLAGFGAAMLAFLWPLPAQTGFGGKVNVGKRCRHQGVHRRRTRSRSTCRWRARTSSRTRRTRDARRTRRRSTSPRSTTTWSSTGSSRCTSAACTSVAACRSASRRSGSSARATARSTTASARRRPGPAPRGLDRLPHGRRRRQVIVDTGSASILGPPIGTNTTGQEAEGPLCV